MKTVIAGLVSLAFMAVTTFGQSGFPSELPSTEKGETAELKLYGMVTQIGTVASRTIRDRSGKIVREVHYYGPWGNPSQPTAEKDLRVQSIKVYFYDTAGRVDHIEHWNAGERRPRVEHNVYDASGELVRGWFVERDGIKRYETRYRNQRTLVELYFDNTGSYLTSLRGHLVSDIDLPHGWGPTSGGMACGITLSTERGRFEQIELNVNIKNVAAKSVSIDNLVEPTFELHDVSGKFFAMRVSARGSKDGRPQLYGQLLDTDEAGYLYPAYRLADYFDPLPPGSYTLRIRQPVPERDAILVSNEISFVVL